MKPLLTGLLLLALSLPVCAQNDTFPAVNTQSMTEGKNIQEIDTYASRFIPRRASLYSAILPGAGQIYNKRYWKVPLIYGGFVALGLTVNFYNDLYKEYRSDLFRVLDDPGYIPPSGASESQLRSAIDDARRERDFWLVMSGVFYLLQIAEAHIDAHLKEFQLNPDLKVSVKPMREQILPGGVYQSGMTLTLRF